MNPVSTRESILASDPDLEKRLVKTESYKAKKGDSLKIAARFLYGHETWWPRLREGNPQFSSFGPDQVLPQNAKLSYEAPAIGKTYQVHPNDWLIRIVQWKYGSTEIWEEIYKKNAKNISNPNLIHPGNILTLELDGTVKKQNTGETILQGVGTDLLPSGQALSLSSQVRDSKTESSLILTGSMTADPSLQHSSPAFYWGVAAGIGLLALLLGLKGIRIYWSKRKQFQRRMMAKSNSAKTDRDDYPYAFKKRPPEDPVITKHRVCRGGHSKELRRTIKSLED